MSGAGSAAMIYLQNNVFDEALERLRMIFDGHDDVIVSMSGGKDSTVLFRMALMVAQERGRLPLKVFWLDQEAEWQATVDYMQHIMELPEVTPYWYQIPFEFTNTLSPEKNFISVWDPEDKAIWIHPQHPLSIKENPSSEKRFHELVNVLPPYCTDSENCAVLVGMRMTESLNRRVAITQHEARYRVHVKEIVLNDIDGTNNANARSRFRIREKAPTYRKRDAAQFEQYMGSKK